MSDKKCIVSRVKASANPSKASGRHKHGPEPERLKIYGDWKEAVRLAMRKQKPAGGWQK
jgi:hypothetical protein